MLMSSASGTREMMQAKRLTRAAATCFRLSGNTLDEALNRERAVDADGEALDCSKHNCVLDSNADHASLVEVLWSLSMYRPPSSC